LHGVIVKVDAIKTAPKLETVHVVCVSEAVPGKLDGPWFPSTSPRILELQNLFDFCIFSLTSIVIAGENTCGRRNSFTQRS
jgi:hypothetical protein